MPVVTSRKPSPEIPFRERVSCTIGEAAAATGLGYRTIERLIADRALDSRMAAGRRLVLVPSLLRLVEGAPAEDPW